MAFERNFLEQRFGISHSGLFSFQNAFLPASLSLSPGLVLAPHQLCHEQAAAESCVAGLFPSIPEEKLISF